MLRGMSMNSKVLQYAKEEYKYHKPKLIVSDNELFVECPAGGEGEAVLILKNDKGISFSGSLFSEAQFINIENSVFSGIENKVKITVNAANMQDKDIIKGIIRIFSECGNTSVRITVHVKKGAYNDNVTLSGLSDFVELYKNDISLAAKIFKNEYFEKNVICGNEKLIQLYRGLKKNKNVRISMEEFLVSAKAKEKVTVYCESSEYNISEAQTPWKQEIVLKKKGWGYASFNVSCQEGFVALDKQSFTTEDFVDDKYSLSFNCDPGFINEGTNLSEISVSDFIDRPVVSITVSVSSGVNEEKFSEEIQKQKAIVELKKQQISFLKGKIKEADFVKVIDEVSRFFENAKGSMDKSILDYYKAALIGDKEKLLKLESYFKDNKDILFDNDIERYISYAVILKRFYRWLHNEELSELCDYDLKSCIKSGEKNYKAFVAMVLCDIPYEDSDYIYESLIDYVLAGNSDPLVYMALCKLINREPRLFADLVDGMSVCLHWGVDNNILSPQASERYAYYLGLKRDYSRMAFCDMCNLYEKYKSDEYLVVICSILLNTSKTDEEYHRWYALGVERGIKLTGLFEFFMYSMDLSDVTKQIPEKVFDYFLYDTGLKLSKRAALYAYIVKKKDKLRHIYKAYADKMRRFTVEQLSNVRVSKDLAVLYEEFITREYIDNDYAGLLARVLFCHEIECYDPSIIGVYVRHPQIESEEFVPLVQGKALVNFYTDDAIVLLTDTLGNRLSKSVDYKINKLMRADFFVNKCYEYIKNDLGLLVYLYDKKTSTGKTGEEVRNLRVEVYYQRGISKELKRKLYVQILKDYHDNYEVDDLDKLLKTLNWKYIPSEDISKVIEICISRNNFKLAMEGVFGFGFERIDAKSLLTASQYLFTEESLKKDDTLIKLGLYLFQKGKYDENTIDYLCRYLSNTLLDMAQLYRIAKNNSITSHNLAERILEMAVVSEELTDDIPDIIKNYNDEKNANHTLILAVLNLYAYRYIIRGRVFPESLIGLLKKATIKDESKACMIASLKLLSEVDLNDDDEEYVGYYLTKLINEGICFSFYKGFANKIDMPYDILSDCYIEYIADPNEVISITCDITSQTNERKTTEEIMTDVYEGVRVKRMLLFRDEICNYTISRESALDGETETVAVSTGTVRGEECDKNADVNAINNFEVINKIIKAYENNNADEFMDRLTGYVFRKSAIENFERFLEEEG